MMSVYFENEQKWFIHNVGLKLSIIKEVSIKQKIIYHDDCYANIITSAMFKIYQFV